MPRVDLPRQRQRLLSVFDFGAALVESDPRVMWRLQVSTQGLTYGQFATAQLQTIQRVTTLVVFVARFIARSQWRPKTARYLVPFDV